MKHNPFPLVLGLQELTSDEEIRGPFLERPGNFPGLYKAIFNSSVSKNGPVYAPETSCMKGTSVHIKNM